jgi:hypothetical protein
MKLRAKLFTKILVIALLSSYSIMSYSDMASENCRIRNSVHSAGEVLTDPACYQIIGSIGQPSPLMDPLEPPL